MKINIGLVIILFCISCSSYILSVKLESKFYNFNLAEFAKSITSPSKNSIIYFLKDYRNENEVDALRNAHVLRNNFRELIDIFNSPHNTIDNKTVNEENNFKSLHNENKTEVEKVHMKAITKESEEKI